MSWLFLTQVQGKKNGKTGCPEIKRYLRAISTGVNVKAKNIYKLIGEM